MDKRRRDLQTIYRLTDWTTTLEQESEWCIRSTGQMFGRGPVVELELGYRAASELVANR